MMLFLLFLLAYQTDNRILYPSHEFYKVSYFSQKPYQKIAIVLPEQGVIDDKMAATRIYTSKFTGEIIKAKIYVLPRTGQKERVLEHEMGHALGWQHYNRKNHIMHPNWWFGGHSSYGLQKM